MAMIDTLLVNDGVHRQASFTVRPDNRFLNSEGVLDPTVIPELVAQTAAAADTHSHGGKIVPGFFALARDIQIQRPLRVHDEVFITATDFSPMDNWFVINFSIALADGTPCATGEISVCKI
jgi:predicted hotdog family 3-hydroxylacyl-ACP dehydratase